ncbi:MAG: hypothetical protein LBQ12_08920 [Deltaproteobacteria bacterium]|jgi:hypothetical protein|nr:hypothetical protein [Deltaproteobacteria bacterium]
MAFVFESGKHPNRYLYLGSSYRDSEGKPRNRRVRIGRIDCTTGRRVYLDGFVGARETGNIQIPPALRARIEEEDRESRRLAPELFGEAAEERRRLAAMLRRRRAPIFTVGDLEGAVSLEGGVFPLLGRASSGSGLLESLKGRLPDSWKGLYALGAFAASRDEGLEAADLWLRGCDGPKADLSPAGVKAVVEGLDMNAAMRIPLDMAERLKGESRVLHPLGDGGRPLAVSARSWLPVDPFYEPGPSPDAPLVLPSFGEPGPRTLRELTDAIDAEYFLSEAGSELTEVVLSAAPVGPGMPATPLHGGSIKVYPEECGGEPMWVLVSEADSLPRMVAVSNAMEEAEPALGHLSLRPYLEEVRAKTDSRLSECLGDGWSARLGEQAGIVKFVALSLAALAWKAGWSSEPLRNLPPSAILRELGGVRRVNISRVSYTKTLSQIQMDIFKAFGHSDWEIKGISGQARPADLNSQK